MYAYTLGFRYNCHPKIQRRVIAVGIYQKLQVELHPITLLVCKTHHSPTPTTHPTFTGSLGPPPLPFLQRSSNLFYFASNNRALSNYFQSYSIDKGTSASHRRRVLVPSTQDPPLLSRRRTHSQGESSIPSLPTLTLLYCSSSLWPPVHKHSRN